MILTIFFIVPRSLSHMPTRHLLLFQSVQRRLTLPCSYLAFHILSIYAIFIPLVYLRHYWPLHISVHCFTVFASVCPITLSFVCSCVFLVVCRVIGLFVCLQAYSRVLCVPLFCLSVCSPDYLFPYPHTPILPIHPLASSSIPPYVHPCILLCLHTSIRLYFYPSVTTPIPPYAHSFVFLSLLTSIRLALPVHVSPSVRPFLSFFC